MRTKLYIGTFLLLICSLAEGYTQDDSTKVKLSEPVPSFDFERTPGIRQDISDLKGKVVLITFFATWCGPCREELPLIESEIYKKYKKVSEFELLIFGREHSWDEVNKFRSDNKFEMPFYPDPQRAVFSKFAGQNIPRSFLISPEGNIIYSSVGFVEKDFEELKKIIKEQLNKLNKKNKGLILKPKAVNKNSFQARIKSQACPQRLYQSYIKAMPKLSFEKFT